MNSLERKYILLYILDSSPLPSTPKAVSKSAGGTDDMIMQLMIAGMFLPVVKIFLVFLIKFIRVAEIFS